MRREIGPWRVVLIFVLGLAAGAQSALYIYDTVDDGVSDPLSGAIAVVFLVAGVTAVWSALRRR
jgi:hypothetical protein